jgi:hypothetical protein
MLSGALLVPAVALAGASTGLAPASLNIPGIAADGSSASVNIGQFLTVDSTTGGVSVNQLVGTTQTRALGVFTFETVGTDTAMQLYNRNSRMFESATGTVIRWDSFKRVDGSFDNTKPVGADSAASFSFMVAANVDPYMTYGLSVKNNTASAKIYGFVFSESIVPAVSGPYNIYSDIAGSLVNSVDNSGLSLGTTVGSTIQKVYLNESSTGNSFSAGVDVGSAYTVANAARGTVAYSGNGVHSASVNGSSGSYTYDSWEFRTDFSLSSGDVATLSGYAEIAPIPELETYAMFAAGLVGMRMVRRRRALA